MAISQSRTRYEELTVATDGLQIIRNCMPDDVLGRLSECFPSDASNIRNALELAAIRELSRSPVIRNMVVPILGEECFAVRAILFNKTSVANWKVAWHQDVVIAVKERADIAEYGPWSIKHGVFHVRPSAAILEKMVAARIHIDDCSDDNGPLRALPGTHNKGVLSDTESVGTNKEGEFVCSVKRGDVILMRPLLLHASSPARNSSSRRVIHIEFASAELPSPLAWHDVVA